MFARGGSKGLPGKNIKRLGEMPLIAHSISVAKAMSRVMAIYVSTDCERIAEVATEYGAEVIRRPDDLARDTSPEWDAWRHAIEVVQSQGLDFDVFLSLPATSPLRSVDDVEACVAALDPSTDAVITVTPAARSPYFNMVSRSPAGYSELLVPTSGFTRRQDAPEAYDITTVAYALRPEFIKSHNSLFSGRVKSVVVPKERSVDIDDAYDFMVAEALYRGAKGES